MPQSPGRPRNWAALDAAHRRRGEMLTLFFDPDSEVFAQPVPAGRRGAPLRFSDATIEALLTVKVILRLSLRAVQGFAHGMAALTGARWAAPHYSTLSRREARLQLSLGAPPAGRRVLVADSTGLKVFGEGEWKVRMHGTDSKRRTWRKVHLLVDRDSGAIVSVALTDKDTADCAVLPALTPQQLQGSFVLADGAYHTQGLHREVHARGGHLLSAPPVNARRWKPHHHRQEEPAFAFRNAQLTPLQRLGRTEWKKQSGYSQRSFVESTNHRLKSLTGDRLAARTFDRQVVEVALRCKALNALAVPAERAKA